MKENEILNELLLDLRSEYTGLKKEADFHRGGREFSRYLNAKAKLARTMLECISLMHDPSRHTLSGGKVGREELTKMIERVEEMDAPVESEKQNLMIYRDWRGRRITHPFRKRSLRVYNDLTKKQSKKRKK